MEEYRCIVIRQDCGGGRVKKIVLDKDTGEIIADCWDSPKGTMFPAGYNAVIREVMLSREQLDTGVELVYITDYNEEPPKVLFQIWQGLEKQKTKKKGHTGNKPGYVKIFTEKFSEIAGKMDDAEIGYLIRLCRFVDWDSGLLVDLRTKEPLDKDSIARVTKTHEKTVRRRLAKLLQVGVIKKDGSNYRVDRRYIAKG